MRTRNQTPSTPAIIFLCPGELNRQVRAAAKKQGLTLSEFIRRAMRSRLSA